MHACACDLDGADFTIHLSMKLILTTQYSNVFVQERESEYFNLLSTLSQQVNKFVHEVFAA